MERREGKALGASAVAVAVVAWLGLVWPDLAAAGIHASPVWARSWVDGALCFAPLTLAPVPALIAGWALYTDDTPS